MLPHNHALLLLAITLTLTLLLTQEDLAFERAALLTLRSAVGDRTLFWNATNNSPNNWVPSLQIWHAVGGRTHGFHPFRSGLLRQLPDLVRLNMGFNNFSRNTLLGLISLAPMIVHTILMFTLFLF